MLHGDTADIAANYEQRDRDLALARIRSAPQEKPDEDDQGNRYCLDCWEVIPQARVIAVQAVRCVDCAGRREQGRHLAAMCGGATRY
ncbi:MAG: hypothetical protein PHG39_02620 [Acidithiobacillus ferrooxidans]|jgi:DnaK suppressor protein|uniref:hypothetical protein n=1 Tax=Acidithiobacillus sp. TaxID=1872118 RepID=UPI0029FB5B2D|nr:hypothetical protein [Acidithiobacillus ferrooxidans]MDD5002892.1 hypothetical protein [Acidithiobacillus sp.]MDD5379466.1 hypothetical protein [Acidithiobacillus sp.]MDD5575906.1 hypothetical protein [Acidithiobacillus sp.]